MKKESWRHRYLRLLSAEANEEIEFVEYTDLEDAKALYELEQSGYVRGVIIRNHIGTPVNARIFGPTVEGRILSEDLHKWIREHSLLGRMQDKIKWAGGWILGIATAIIIHYLTGNN